MEESELIERLKKGDRDAKEELVRQTQDFLFNSVFQLCHDKMVAEDVVVEAYLLAFKNIKSFKGESTLRTWLYRIAKNELMAYFNKNKKYVVKDMSYEQAKKETDFDDYEKALLLDAMEGLDIEDREIITAIDINGLSYEDASTMLGMPLGTVKSRIVRARDKLHKILKEKGYF